MYTAAAAEHTHTLTEGGRGGGIREEGREREGGRERERERERERDPNIIAITSHHPPIHVLSTTSPINKVGSSTLTL